MIEVITASTWRVATPLRVTSINSYYAVPGSSLLSPRVRRPLRDYCMKQLPVAQKVGWAPCRYALGFQRRGGGLTGHTNHTRVFNVLYSGTDKCCRVYCNKVNKMKHTFFKFLHSSRAFQPTMETSSSVKFFSRRHETFSETRKAPTQGRTDHLAILTTFLLYPEPLFVTLT